MSRLEREDNHPAGEQSARTPAGGADPVRRRLTSGGLAGAGVLMTVASRSALGQVVGGCGSESASAALSRNGELSSCGCSPGFWWNENGQRVWTEYLGAYPQTATFNAVFCSGLPLNVKPFFQSDNVTLLEAHKEDGGPYPDTNYPCEYVSAVGMHAVAALLNAEFYGVRYPAGFTSGAEVIQAFQAALGGGCGGLNQFKGAVDVYDDNGGLWCFNGKDWGD